MSMRPVKREFLMLAHAYNGKDVLTKRFLWSEKLDGMRAFWDGGLTRGLKMPWDADRESTGLWSRYGKVVAASDWFLNKLPRYPLDGELWLGRDRFQELISISKNHVPDSRWYDVQYKTFDSPGLADVFKPGVIENAHMQFCFGGPILMELKDLARERKIPWEESQEFEQVLPRLTHAQTPFTSMVELEECIDTIISQGGEGVVLRHIWSKWTPERSHKLLKIKPAQDAEGIVVGYNTGDITDKGSQHRGRIGSLQIQMLDPETGKPMTLATGEPKTFLLPNLLQNEREFCMSSPQGNDPFEWAWEHPDQLVPDWIESVSFKRGQTITYKFRSLTKEGLPKEASYVRQYAGF